MAGPEAAAGAPMSEETATSAAILAAARRSGRPGRARPAGQGSGEPAGDPQLDRRHRRRQPALHRRRASPRASVHGQLVAPPAMVQVWTMPGLQPPPADGGADPLGQMMTALDEAGFTSVVATNCAQTYHRYLRHGELLEPARRADRRHRAEAHRARRGLVRDHEERLVLRRRAGRRDGLAGAEVPAPVRPRERSRGTAAGRLAARARRPPVGCGRGARHATAGLPGHRVLLGRDAGRRAADPALRRVRRAAAPARARVPELRRHRAIRATRSRPGPARSTATWCTAIRRCPASSCRSSSRSSS